MEPSAGWADVSGRVSSLLEVGTGFHPELTGRENVYLSGALLGMKKADIRRHFDEIVAFAEVAKFIDMPVKRYSTGMFLRLGFAVAAHLQADILLVDEVLAVGDAGFQRKCLGQLGGVADQGRTVLFVSHNMGAIRSICRRGIVLDQGRAVLVGDINTCIEKYYRSIGAFGHEHEDNGQGDEADSAASMGRTMGPIRLNGSLGSSVHQSESFELSTRLNRVPSEAEFTVFCRIDDMHGRPICRLREESSNLREPGAPIDGHTLRLRFPPLWLNPGLYAVDLALEFYGEYGGQRTAATDKFPLDFVGTHGSSDAELRLDPILQPSVNWWMGREARSG
jgi:lipopolysaccharide transport system ATP-binding protein